ncbi:unnamed protein product [Anisakis simplex]|uniref:Ovule protein n=1 Tax=Anisakis simplex TaxID=6269 RepID=A0A0M3K8K3_ANISI|nr:unnamed protein product [Anisakis simplex]
MNLDMCNVTVYSPKKRRRRRKLITPRLSPQPEVAVEEERDGDGRYSTTRAVTEHHERFFVCCRFIKFIHFDNYIDVIGILQRSVKKLNKIGGTNKFETSKKSYQAALTKNA